jgi:hypothetical protein
MEAPQLRKRLHRVPAGPPLPHPQTTLAVLAYAYLAVTAANAPKSPGSGLIPVTLRSDRRDQRGLVRVIPRASIADCRLHRGDRAEEATGTTT